AVGRLCREPGHERLIELLHHYAPTWLVQMPALVSEEEREALHRQVHGTTPERMLREMAEALEALSAEQGIILWLEDLHWSDVSTVDLLLYLARRRGPARLLVIGSYRPTEVSQRGHPLKGVSQELQGRGQCEELALRALTRAEVTQYLAGRLAAPSPALAGEAGPEQSRRSRGEGLIAAPLQHLAQVIHQRTEGNPLFMVTVVNDLVTQGVIEDGSAGVQDIALGVPASVRQVIEQQFERLSPERQRMLEAASVAGSEFLTVAIAAGSGEGVEQVETWCEEFVRQGHFLRAQGTETLPEGTVSGRYGFLHALYQTALYERLAETRRMRLHRRIGERLEAGYGSQADSIAAELALHFERGHDHARAVHYHEQAAQTALRRSAHREAIIHLTTGLEFLKTLPDTPERARHELTLQLALGVSLRVIKGYGAPEVEHVYTQARALCQQIGETPQMFPVLWGLCYFYIIRAEYQTARELAEQCLSLAQSVRDPAFLAQAYFVVAADSFCLGKFTSSREYSEQSLAFYTPQQHRSHIALYSQDPKVTSLTIAAWALWVLGYPDQALKRSHEVLSWAQELSHPFSLAYAFNNTTWFHQCRREEQATQERAEAAIALCNEQGFTFLLAWTTIFRGWALAEQGQAKEGVTQIHQGLAILQTTGTESFRPYFLALLAEAYGKMGQAEEGLTVLAEALALVNKTGERWWEAEMYRLKGQLTLQSKVQSPKSKVQSRRPPAPDPRPPSGGGSRSMLSQGHRHCP
ncbi:MAG: ATP-binding protein, partial [Candidatus Binatia bacterium]